MRRWQDVLPEDVARKQARWERQARVVRARQAGATFAAIGRGLGVSRSHTAQIAREWRGGISPIEQHLAAIGFGVERLSRREWKLTPAEFKLRLHDVACRASAGKARNSRQEILDWQQSCGQVDENGQVKFG